VHSSVKVVHFKTSDKYESSLTLRVALNNCWHALILRHVDASDLICSNPLSSEQGGYESINKLVLKLDKARLP